ncbi:MAG: hydantoinase/oxoprolinase family protein, partial [Gammaproteobacteria bacterium]|nr:hydantoinase/oxoprolinase family protein [Gammaproteobacteria bacterium]
ASVDKLERIQVGPESAGSEPGPAAYGRGGQRPTVTDADVHLGRIHAAKFAGGALQLDAEASAKAIENTICKALHLDPDVGAFGISEVVDENMAAAARTHAAEFGMDLGQRDMIAFGGAAPLHAARLGEKLGVRRIIVPTEAGVGSAVGFLLAPIAYEVVRSRRQRLSSLQPDLVNSLMRDMVNEAVAVVRQGSSAPDLAETRQAYMRYVGQGHEIAVNLPVEEYDDSHAGIFKQAFEAAYTKLYGRTIDGIEIEALSWTLTISAPTRKVIAETAEQKGKAVENATQTQSCFDPLAAERVDVPVYFRDQLSPGDRLDGPALITEDQTTTFVTSGFVAEIDARGYIVLTRKRGSEHE